MTDILMPALSPTMEEGALSKWNVKVGDAVAAGDVIAEIETDKATMEVEAVDEGVVEAILVEAGAQGVKVNTPIARLKTEAQETPPARSDDKAGKPTDAAAGKPAEPPAETQGTFGASADDARAPRDAVAKAAADAPASPTPEAQARAQDVASPASAAPAPAEKPAEIAPRTFASPLARRLAHDKGLALEDVKGTGPHGRIVAADVNGAPQKAAAPASRSLDGAEPAPPPAAIKSLAQMGIPDGSYDLVPLDGMRKTIARRMTESARDIPHFPLTVDLEIDRLLEARASINKALERSGTKVSVNDMIIKAAAAALRVVPDANASYTPEGRALHHHADVAVAVAVDGGLITPIVRAAETRSLADIAGAMKDLAQRARDKKLKPEEFLGGTFSVSNLGMFGIKSFSSIINEPQGAILSVGTGEKRAVVRGDALAVATVMTVTLTCDHRVVDGAIGARWLQAFKGFIEDPITLLA